MIFRRDINGLRAIALVGVLIFHFKPNWLAGGFSGVDVFFVISGFLMTKIIFTDLENAHFSLSRFYLARAKRIVPALAVLCGTLLLIGWFLLFSFEFENLLKHALSSLAFFSNITYFNEVNYFDSSAYEKWLLHTWSLSLEWQFYLLYPLCLLVLKKLTSFHQIKKIILISTIIGFLINVIASDKWPNASYYLLPARFWELTAGGIAFLYPLALKNKQSYIFEALGLAFILFSFIFVSNQATWPGYLALLPVLGTYFIIQAQRQYSLITGNVVFQKLGKWSYSIYLWHWPIVVAIYYFALSDIFIYLGLILSILFGFLSHHYIEQYRNKNHENDTLVNT